MTTELRVDSVMNGSKLKKLPKTPKHQISFQHEAKGEGRMGILGLIKDVILLPVDIALDATGITPLVRTMEDDDADTPFGTVDRLRSIVKNMEQTRDV